MPSVRRELRVGDVPVGVHEDTQRLARYGVPDLDPGVGPVTARDDLLPVGGEAGDNRRPVALQAVDQLPFREIPKHHFFPSWHHVGQDERAIGRNREHDHGKPQLEATHLADLYRLDEPTLAALDRMGKKSAVNLVAAIDATRTRSLDRFVTGLTIRHVGTRGSEVLAERFETLEELRKASLEVLAGVPRSARWSRRAYTGSCRTKRINASSTTYSPSA